MKQLYANVTNTSNCLYACVCYIQTEKKQIQAESTSDANLLNKSSLDIALVKEHPDDVHMASLLQYSAVKSKTVASSVGNQSLDSTE